MYTKLGYALLVVSFLLWKLDIGILWSGLCFIGACILLLPEKGRYVSSANKIVIITGELSI